VCLIYCNPALNFFFKILQNMVNVKVFADRQTGQKLYAPDLSIQWHKKKIASVGWRYLYIVCYHNLCRFCMCVSTAMLTSHALLFVLTLTLKFDPFLAHLSWKLKWAFLIARCPASVCLSVCPSVRPSVRLSVRLSVCKLLHFRLLL
jgi:hypothetical protein